MSNRIKTQDKDYSIENASKTILDISKKLNEISNIDVHILMPHSDGAYIYELLYHVNSSRVALKKLYREVNNKKLNFKGKGL